MPVIIALRTKIIGKIIKSQVLKSLKPFIPDKKLQIRRVSLPSCSFKINKGKDFSKSQTIKIVSKRQDKTGKSQL